MFIGFAAISFAVLSLVLQVIRLLNENRRLSRQLIDALKTGEALADACKTWERLHNELHAAVSARR